MVLRLGLVYFFLLSHSYTNLCRSFRGILESSGTLSFLVVGLMTHRAYDTCIDSIWRRMCDQTIGLLETLQASTFHDIPSTVRFFRRVARSSISLQDRAEKSPRHCTAKGPQRVYEQMVARVFPT